MSNIKYLDMEDISYKDWSDHLDFVANSHVNPWLPAYGYHSTSTVEEIFNDDNDPFVIDNSSAAPQPYLVLETIVEETSDDLRSESDKSGPAGWNSDSDADSVIHLPKFIDKTGSWKLMEPNEELPRRKKRRVVEKFSLSDDDEQLENIETTSISSRSSSLIAFESLEKHCEDVFVTNVAKTEFTPCSIFENIKNFSNFSDSSRGSRDGFESSDEEYGFSSSADTLLRPYSCFDMSLSNGHRLKTYRSFDSLNFFEKELDVNYVLPELSLSQTALDYEKEKLQEQDFVIRDKKLTATTADLSLMADSYENDFRLILPKKKKDSASFHFKKMGSGLRNPCVVFSEKARSKINNFFSPENQAHGLKNKKPQLSQVEKNCSSNNFQIGHENTNLYSNTEPKSQPSAENLSEDSGFGDQIPSKSKISKLNNFENLNIPETEDSSFSESSNFSDLNGNEEVISLDPFKVSNMNKNSDSLKITRKQEGKDRLQILDDVDVKINIDPNETQTFNCIRDKKGIFKMGEAEKLIATSSVSFASSGGREFHCSFCCSDIYLGKSAFNNSFTQKQDYLNKQLINKWYSEDLIAEIENANVFTQNKMNIESEEKNKSNRSESFRFSNFSTPNFFDTNENFIQKRPSSALSLSHVPLKYYDEHGVQMEEIKNKLLDFRKTGLECDFEKSNKTGGIKEVHFHPVVSEVSWKDSYSDSFTNSSSTSFVEEPSIRSLEELCEIKNDEQDFHEAEEKSISKNEFSTFEIQKGQPNFNFKNTSEPNLLGIEETGNAENKTNSRLEPEVIKDFDVTNKILNANDNQFETKTFVREKPVTPTILESSTSGSHVFAIGAKQANSQKKTRLAVSSSSLLAEDHDNAAHTSLSLLSTSKEMTTKKPKKRLGGFLERFSFRRFSNRMLSSNISKRHIGKKEKKPKEKEDIDNKSATENHQEIVTIIPLHGPENEEEINEIFRSVVTSHVVSSKPPLPPNFQRMPGGSRKRFSFLENLSAELQDVDSNKKENMPGDRENVWTNNYSITNTVLVNSSGNVRPKQEISEKSVGLLETDLDTHITVESAIDRKEQLIQNNGVGNKKARSLMNLGLQEMNGHHKLRNATLGYLEPTNHRTQNLVAVDDRAKSMEFLLDKENQVSVLPPENELQKGGPSERVLSEHQLRFQRSVQKLSIPEWYKSSALSQTPQGFLLKRNSDAGREHQGWPGLSSKTTSLSNLGSSRSVTAKCLNQVLGPSPTSHLFTRWSTSRLNSGFYSVSTSPSYSTRSSFNYRQPYLGWRSQERLTKPRTPAERLAADLLPFQKHQLPAQHNNQTALNPILSDVRTSIKEVTSAIVHYVSGVQDNDPKESLRASQAGTLSSPKWQSSPRGSTSKLCWLESSFVGSRPLDQPETPLTLAESLSNKSETRTEELHLDLKPFTSGNPVDYQLLNETTPTNLLSSQEKFEKTFEVRKRFSPASTTLDDILESLLGLPPTSRSPSPSPLYVTSAAGACTPRRSFTLLSLPDEQQQRFSGDVQANISGSISDPGNADFAKEVKIYRRKSETGIKLQESFDHSNKKVEESTQDSKDMTNKKDLHSHLTETLVKCRYSKCGKMATVLDAKKTFKTCHNCAHVYCSRECRRAHWERHRRTCLHSRVGALCKQVLIAAKEDAKTLNLISLLARRGYVTHGRGAVKIFFSSPELAENFVTRGNDELSDPAYVKWSDLLPAEMGVDLFRELTKLCKSYNPDTRLVLYVAICVVSEVPTSGAVKWERQLISRCCKIPLDKSLIPPKPEKQIPPPLPPRKSSSNSVNITREMENPETLILTSLPGVAGTISEEKIREISFTNIQRELKVRGVSLRRQFPNVYKNLCSYVEGTLEHFTPVTIYPRDVISGKTFMCIIMPESEPEKLDLVPKDSFRIKTVNIGVERIQP